LPINFIILFAIPSRRGITANTVMWVGTIFLNLEFFCPWFILWSL